MSLRIWLPLNGDLHNQGLDNPTIVNNGTTINNNGKIGKCYEFGASKYIKIMDYASTFLTFNNFSLSVWFKCTAQNTSHAAAALISCGNWNSAGNLLNLGLHNFSTDHYSKLLITNSGTWSNGYSYNFYLDKWYHVVLTSGNGATKAYVNGELIGSSYSDFIPTTLAQSWICIGNATYAQAFNFYGLINDVRIYNNALSQQQIKQIAKGLILHYPLNRSNYGEPNLITKSTLSSAPWADAITGTEFYKGKNAIIVKNNILYSKTSAGTISIFPNIVFEQGIQYTISLDWCDHLRTDGKNCSLYIRFKYTDGTNSQIISPASNSNAQWTHASMTSTAGKIISMMTTTYGNGGDVSIANLKLEKGSQETKYSPAINEIGNIQYDISGYQNNGIKHNITYDSDTPKYEVSSVFTSANTSYVKVSENNWIPQYQQAMTINLWVYSANWASTTKLFSCTESGGWNTESGSSGYIRFPVYVATNSGRTSHGYKYSSKELKISDMTAGWHMLTFIYDSTGNKVYVDGQLHSSYAYTSYGIKYNINARLFLGCEASTASPASPYLNGKMSDFRIYVTALSAEDILSLYNNEAEIDQSGIIHGQIR